MKNENCIFCKIAAGEIPSATIYEDADFRVILDIEPASKGHALILPKEHYANLYELPEELASKVLVVAKKVVTAMTEVLGCDGYNVLQNNGEVAGQTVFHFHMHLIPRYKDDQVNIKWKPGTLKEEWKEEILAKMNEK
jgi:histidine triad (HIT) family protein